MDRIISGSEAHSSMMNRTFSTQKISSSFIEGLKRFIRWAITRQPEPIRNISIYGIFHICETEDETKTDGTQANSANKVANIAGSRAALGNNSAVRASSLIPPAQHKTYRVVAAARDAGGPQGPRRPRAVLPRERLLRPERARDRERDNLNTVTVADRDTDRH